MKVGKNPSRFLSLLLTVVSAQGLIASETLVLREGSHEFYPWLVRIDSLGDTLWTKLYSLRDDSLVEIENVNQGERPRMGFGNNSITASMDGGYLIYLDLNVLFKVDSSGVPQWSRSFYFGPTREHWTSDLLPTCDGGFVTGWDHITAFVELGCSGLPVAVETVLLKLDADGDSVWARTFPGVQPEIVVPSNDCGFIIAGMKFKNESIVCLMKLDSLGDLVWRKEYLNLVPISLKVLPDRRMIMSGPAVDSAVTNTSTCYGIKHESMRCELDSAGNILGEYKLWDHRGLNLRWVDPENDDRLYPDYLSLEHIVTSDGGYFLAGDISYWNESEDEGGLYYALTCFKFDSLGYLDWYKQYIEEPERRHTPRVIELPDGYLVCSQMNSWEASNSDIWIFRLDTTGEVIWSKTYGNERNEFAGTAYPTGDGGFLILAKRAPQIYVIEHR